METKHDLRILADRVQGRINADRGESFNLRLPSQTEQCARKVLERLQIGLASGNLTDHVEILALSQSAEILLTLRDRYSNGRSSTNT
jgi:hypothetical protein